MRTLVEPDDRKSSWHLYPIRFGGNDPSATRAAAYASMRGKQIGVNVHYRPVHLHSYYRSLGYSAGTCPVAEAAYEGLLSLPMWPGLTNEEQEYVVELVTDIAGR